MTNPAFRVATGVLAALLAAAPAAAQEVRLRPAGAIYLDARGSGLKAPEGVDSDGRSLLIVADTGNRRLLRYELVSGRLAPTGEIRLPQLPYPTQVRLDPSGQILALDGRSHRIVRVGPNGEFRGLVELDAGDRGEVLVKGFEVDDEGQLYVLDAAGARILVFGSGGGLRRQIAFPAEVGFVSDLAVDSAGMVFAVDSVRRRVLAARTDEETLVPLAGGLAADSAFPTAIVADRLGRLFLADQGGGGILILERSGALLSRQSAMGWKEGYLRHPSGLSAVDGQLFVADRGNNRIQVFSIVD